MEKMKRSCIALLLAFTILFSAYPFQAIAEDAANSNAASGDEPQITEEGYLTGKLKLVMDGEEITEMKLGDGEKSYLYTELSGVDESKVKYTWQILIDREQNSWAVIKDYLLSYAVVSDALIKNNPNDNGHATIRCIADDGTNKYVSKNVEIEKRSPLFLATNPTPDASDETESTDVSDDSLEDANNSTENADAFHIVIRYVFCHKDNDKLNGTNAASTFTITLPNSTSYTGTIASPPVVGYTPYIPSESGTFEYGGQKYAHAAYHSFEQQATDVTVTIYYIPDIVNYMVKYYEQNLYNDEYTYAGTVVKTGYSDTTVAGDLATERDGFSALAYDKDTLITGDGAAAVEIYYDRIYCLVNVELGKDAHGVVPYYVRFDTQLILGTPTRPGYTFKGWELTQINGKTKTELNEKEQIAWTVYEVGNVAGTMLTINQSVATKLLYEAQWERASTTYTTIYWVENADDDGYTLWGYRVHDAIAGDLVSAQDDMVREDKDAFIFNANRSDKNITVEGDGTTAVNAYYTRKYYSLVFKAGTDCYVTEHTHGDGNCVTPNICGNETTHTHDDSCGEGKLICDYEEEHTHTEACRNSCKIPPHEAHTDSCLKCTIQPHTHTWECYSGASNETPSRYTRVEGQAQNGFIGRSGSRWSGYTYWIYVEGTWYRYSGTVAYGSQSPTNSRVCPGIHVHSEANGCYKDSIHIHNEYCCNIPEHIHNATCYEYACGLKQHAHESCFRECILYEHTHTSGENCGIAKVITKKYGANITDMWPITNGTDTYNNGERWSPQSSSTYKDVLVYIPFMPAEDITFKVDIADRPLYTMNYYLEALPGSTDPIEFEGLQYNLINTIGARYNHLTKAEDFFDIIGFTQYKASPTDFNSSGQISTNGGTVNMYYKRNEYSLVYNNNGIVMDNESKILKYQASLKDCNKVPEYPSNMEEGACEFAGWYYTPHCTDGTEVDFEKDIMPAGDLIIYAKWIPRKYTVEIYMDNTWGNLIASHTVYFNAMILEPLKEDFTQTEPGDMPTLIPDATIFAGWYYMDGEVEKRFDFNTMMIKKNYKIYAKWTSLIPVDYVIHYMVKHGEDRYEKIADDETGQALKGITKSFTAKAGEKLYASFRTGYYPEERSVSVKMDRELNEFTFIYEHRETVHYTLIHTFTDNSTGSDGLSGILGYNQNHFEISFDYEVTNASDTPAERILSFRERVTEENIKAAIKATIKKLAEKNQSAVPNASELEKKATQAWEIVKELSPHTYEQEIILVTDHTDGENNVIFNWEPRSNTCIYQIMFFTQDLTASPDATVAENYTLLRTQSSNLLDYAPGKTVSFTIPDEIGFDVNTTLSNCKKDANGNYVLENEKYVCEGTLTKPTVGNDVEGLVFRVYYDREMLSYSVLHVAGTTNITVQRDPVPYGTTVTEIAKDVPNVEDQQLLDRYYVQGDVQKSAKIEEDGQQIIFTYRLHVINYYYLIVGGGSTGLRGTLSTASEVVDVNATPVGCIPTAYPGYMFAGWFTDPEGTVPVTDQEATVGALNNTIIPIPSPEDVNAGQYFYAKFVPTRIVIQNNNVIDENHSFVYRLKGIAGTDTGIIDLVITVVGNGSVTVAGLPTGDYVLTPNNDWAYRYEKEEIRFTFDDNKTVWVTYDTASEKWIGDCEYSKVQ